MRAMAAATPFNLKTISMKNITPKNVRNVAAVVGSLSDAYLYQVSVDLSVDLGFMG